MAQNAAELLQPLIAQGQAQQAAFQERIAGSQAVQQGLVGQSVQRPGDERAAGGLITGHNARKRIKEQQTIDTQYAQAQANIDNQRQAVTDARSLIDLGIAEQDLRQEFIKTKVDGLEFERSQGMGMDPEKLIAVSNGLRDERNADLAPFISNLASFDELASIQGLNSGPASFATLFKFIKSMDDSVVRSSEGELLTSSTGKIREFANQYNAAVGRGFFDETTTAEIMQTAQTMAESNFKTATEVNDRHDKLVGQFATRFMEPGLVGLTQSARFNQDRQFGPLGEAEKRVAEEETAAQSSASEALPGFTPN